MCGTAMRVSAIKFFFCYVKSLHPDWLYLAAHVLVLAQKQADLQSRGYLDYVGVRALLDAPAPDTVTGLCDRAMRFLASNARLLRVSTMVARSWATSSVAQFSLAKSWA